DTHDNQFNVLKAARKFREHGVQLVIHLGDIVAPFTLVTLAKELEGVKIEAVFGNNDGEKRLLVQKANELKINIDEPRSIVINNKKLFLLHGIGTFDTTQEVVNALAESRKWDAILYGHTHEPRVEYINGVLVLNPGDASGYLSYLTKAKPSIALLDVEVMKARIVNLED
ncbi:MAG: metallophosphoesterase, partial [Acidilobaceae archaeon]